MPKRGPYKKKPKVYKKTDKTPYVKKKGEITKNDQLSEDLTTTEKLWTEQGYVIITDHDVMLKLNTEDNLKVRYITMEGMARQGGILITIVNRKERGPDGLPIQYMILKNHYLNRMWSVQIRNIDKLFINYVAPKDALSETSNTGVESEEDQ